MYRTTRNPLHRKRIIATRTNSMNKRIAPLYSCNNIDHDKNGNGKNKNNNKKASFTSTTKSKKNVATLKYRRHDSGSNNHHSHGGHNDDGSIRSDNHKLSLFTEAKENEIRIVMNVPRSIVQTVNDLNIKVINNCILSISSSPTSKKRKKKFVKNIVLRHYCYKDNNSFVGNSDNKNVCSLSGDFLDMKHLRASLIDDIIVITIPRKLETTLKINHDKENSNQGKVH